MSALGFSGTNAHVVLEAAPALPQIPPSDAERPLHLVTLSGRTREALAEQAATAMENATLYAELAA